MFNFHIACNPDPYCKDDWRSHLGLGGTLAKYVYCGPRDRDLTISNYDEIIDSLVPDISPDSMTGSAKAKFISTNCTIEWDIPEAGGKVLVSDLKFYGPKVQYRLDENRLDENNEPIKDKAFVIIEDAIVWNPKKSSFNAIKLYESIVELFLDPIENKRTPKQKLEAIVKIPKNIVIYLNKKQSKEEDNIYLVIKDPVVELKARKCDNPDELVDLDSVKINNQKVDLTPSPTDEFNIIALKLGTYEYSVTFDGAQFSKSLQIKNDNPNPLESWDGTAAQTEFETFLGTIAQQVQQQDSFANDELFIEDTGKLCVGGAKDGTRLKNTDLVPPFQINRDCTYSNFSVAGGDHILFFMNITLQNIVNSFIDKTLKPYLEKTYGEDKDIRSICISDFNDVGYEIVTDGKFDSEIALPDRVNLNLLKNEGLIFNTMNIEWTTQK